MVVKKKEKMEMQAKNVDLGLLGSIAVAIVFTILVLVLFNKFKVNDQTVDVINGKLDVIESDVDTLQTSVFAIQHYPKYADFVSYSSNTFDSNEPFAIVWDHIAVNNDCHFQIKGITLDSDSNAIKVPKASNYQVTSTIMLIGSNNINDSYAYYVLNGTILADSKRHIDIIGLVDGANGNRVAEIVLSQIVALTCEDRLAVVVLVNQGTDNNAGLFNASDMPSARLSIVRL